MENDMVQEGELLWTPQPEFAKRSQIARYQDWLRAERGIDHAIDDYAGLWKWSVSEPEKFWETIWDYFDVQARSEEHTSELQSLMRISYAVFCLKTKTQNRTN